MTDPTAHGASHADLVDLLCRVARERPTEEGYIFLGDGENEEARLGFAELERRARAVAALLQTLTREGDRAVLMYPSGLEFLVGLFGCLFAGVVAVPAYAPRPNRGDPRLTAIMSNSGARVVLTARSVGADPERYLAQFPELAALHWVATDAVPEDRGAEWRPPSRAGDGLAVLQYTSGSTGTPRGVRLTHRNLLDNLAAMKRVLSLRAGVCGVTWLPAFHDMGLVGNLFQAVYTGCSLVLLPPAAFVQKPLRWLRAVSRYRAFVSGGPNFAFDLCVRKIPPEARADLDLSCWRSAYVGSEPITPETLDRFVEAFGPCGFRRKALLPCYGLAEATLMVSGERGPAGPVFLTVDKHELERNRWMPVPPTSPVARRLVGCGRPLPELDVRVVDPGTSAPSGPGEVGEVWVAGPSVSGGYWNAPRETEQVFHGRLAGAGGSTFLQTGDLGFIADGELFVAGRIKDVIVIRGRNIYPQDIEAVVENCHPALRPASGAAFAPEPEDGGEYRLVIVQELERDGRRCDPGEVIGAVRRAVAERFELEVAEVALVKPGGVPKTSSGKVQRREAQQRLRIGTLEVVHHWKRAGEDPGPTAHDNGAAVVRPPDRNAIRSWLVARLARHAKLAPADIDVDQPFAWYGLDSVTLVSVAAELEEWLGRKLAPTLLYDAPTVEALVNFLSGVRAEGEPSRKRLMAAHEPIAIVGIGCRFPGAGSPAGFWELLREGGDAVAEQPPGRRSSLPAAPRGGFLPEVDQFDPRFFGIAPNEAVSIDPQHRLILEVTWEALEDAGQAPERLAGASVGVFVGISNGDYGRLLLAAPGGVGAHAGTGNALSMAANRVSYFLDLRGPSLAVDTACSSSLVAVHLACQSLRCGECTLALAAGVNLILAPELGQALAEARMLAPDGRCKTFDAGADGYARGEGCGVVVLKPLAAALADRDRVLAVIRGSAVNQGGRTNGLTAPSGLAQAALLGAALADAGATPAQVSYVEAHGTGTELGDPIEFGALKAALGEGDAPCAVGSVKTNIGHLEAAAGIAGLIKTALALHHGEIPPHLHLRQLNPHIDLKGTRFHVPTSRQPWLAGEGRRLAGVSSFGFGGANAHVILEEAPPRPVHPPVQDRPAHLLVLSARTGPALRETAARYANWLRSHPDNSLAGVCFTAATGRAHLGHRLAVTGRDAGEMSAVLEAFAAGRQPEHLATGTLKSGSSGRVAFLFSGQGAQTPGMGRQLYETCPVFRQAYDRCDAIIRECTGQSLLPVLYPEDPGSCLLEETGYAQPALFALEYSLAETWRGWGIVPAAVLGHSLGEYVAACVAGVFTPEDALRLVARRGQLMQNLPDNGEMATVFAPAEAVAEALAPFADRVAVAAVNGPRSVVVSGKRPAVRALCRRLEGEGFDTRPLGVPRAMHSPCVEPMLDALERLAEATPFAPPHIPLVANLTGALADDGDVQTPAYWRRHAREPVQFARGVEALRQLGVDTFVEVGPRPLLTALGPACLPRGYGSWHASLRRGGDYRALLDALGALHTRGVRVDWNAVDGGATRERVALPTYPFERQRYWFPSAATAEAAAPHANGVHPPERNGHAAEGLPTTSRNGKGHHAPGPAEIARELETDAARLGERLLSREAAGVRAKFDRLAARYVTRALTSLGLSLRPGERFTADELAARLRIQPRYGWQLTRLLEILGEDGYLSTAGSYWEVRRTPDAGDPAKLLAELLTRYPAFEAELTLAGRCGDHLAEVLRGSADPLAVLFPDGSLEPLERLYRDSPFARYANHLAERAVAAVLTRLSRNRPPRLLEIGAGTGGLTAHILPALSGDVEYVFTDASGLFLAQARDKFRAHRNVAYRLLDVEKDPRGQGFSPHIFDVIVAANVLHATADLRQTLRHVRALLAARGVLVLVEGTGPQRLFDLVFGLTEGWWKFADHDLRPRYPLLPAGRWLTLLREEGFAEAAALPPRCEGAPEPDQIVLIAQGPVVESEGATAAVPDQITPPLPREEAPGLSREAVLRAPPSERRKLLEDQLRRHLAQVLGLTVAEIDPDAPVNALGLDSLLAIQLKNRIQADLGAAVPVVAFLQGLSLSQVVDKVLEALADGEEAPDERPAAGDLDRMMAEVDRMSEGELDKVLGELLARESNGVSRASAR